MTKEQMEKIIQENMQKIYLYCVKHRDMAGDELRKKTPTAIQGANEVGAIVSMWSMLEAMVSVVLEEGYMTKGDGQNLTAIYFKTENE